MPGFEEPCPGLERERLVRRLFAWLIPLLAVAACAAGGGLTGPAGHGEMVYRTVLAGPSTSRRAARTPVRRSDRGVASAGIQLSTSGFRHPRPSPDIRSRSMI